MASPLIQSITNKILDHISQYNDLPRSLEPESDLAEKFGVSRSTIRKIINNLPARVPKIEGRTRIILKRPLRKDYYNLNGEELSKGDLVENLFLNKLSNNELEPDAHFSELQLAKEFHCTTGTVREVLIKISQLGIIQKEYFKKMAAPHRKHVQPARRSYWAPTSTRRSATSGPWG